MLLSIAVSALNLKQEWDRFQSEVITIDGEIIMSEKKRSPPITIYARDITTIKKTKKGKITISGNKKHIVIPSDIESYEEMIAMLSKLKPITET